MADIKSPITGGPVREVRGVKKFDFRNETYDVPVRFYKCVESQEEFTSGEQDEEWSSSLYSLCINLREDVECSLWLNCTNSWNII